MANIITELHLEMSANWYVSKKLNSIGRVGENTVTKLIIEPTEIINNVTYEIEIMSADGSKNVAELTVDGTELYLILTANMLTTSGIMKMQVRGLFTDGSIKKSNIFELKVNRSISATDYYEEYAVTIFDQLVQDCRDIIEGAESYAIRAETAAVNAEAYEQSASASAEAASGYADNASGYADNAASSATAANTSATSASASATSAVTSETNAAASAALASTSATNANTSATNAANSATSAATSATNAHNSEVNASTSETNASTSAAEAEASAESIAASVAQINENTYHINALEAIIGGYQLTDLPTGAVASVTDGTALLMPSLRVGIEPVQDLHGYDHPWAGGAGKNKYPVMVGRDAFADILSATHTTDNDTLSVTMASTTNSGVYSTPTSSFYSLSSTLSGSYVCSFDIKGSVSGAVRIGYEGEVGRLDIVITTSWQRVSIPLTFSATGKAFDVYNISGSGMTVDVKNLQIEQGSTATSYEPYSNICPISGWTEANVVVSPTTSAEDGTTYNIQFTDGTNPLTVYGGTLDVTTGELVVTHVSDVLRNLTTTSSYTVGSKSVVKLFKLSNTSTSCEPNQYHGAKSNIAKELPAYFGAPRVNETLPSHIGTFAIGTGGDIVAVYDEDITMTEADYISKYENTQVWYPLATPTTYQLTPTQIRTLVGNNNIWADTGDIIEGKYYRSLS